MKKILVVLCFALISVSAKSQGLGKLDYSGFFDTYYQSGPLNIIPTLSLAGLNGDLANGFYANDLKPSFGLEVNYKVWPRIYFGGAFNYLSLSGSDKVAPLRGITYKTTIYEFMPTVRVNILEETIRKHGERRQKPMRVKPYFHTGIGLMLANPTSTTGDTSYFNGAYPKENIKTPVINLAIPVGLGLQFYITPRFSVLLEGSVRVPVTDYIDGVSARGGSNKDVYYTTDLKLQFSPWAPKRKKKSHSKIGNMPAGEGGGGGGNDSTGAQPKEKPAAPKTEEVYPPIPGDSTAPEGTTPPADGTAPAPADGTTPAPTDAVPAQGDKKKEEAPAAW